MAFLGPRPVLHLASRSPRRAELLTKAGVAFQPVTPGPEPEGTGSPIVRAIQRATSKAEFAKAPSDVWVLGVDTVVELDGVSFDQPVDAEQAAATLRALAGRVHLVHTAHVLKCGRQVLSGVATAAVACTTQTERDFCTYLQSEAWRGKAGAYGIQDPGCWFMKLVAGEFDTVVGLSIRTLEQLLTAVRT